MNTKNETILKSLLNTTIIVSFLLFKYTGLIFGDFASGFLSQFMKSRKKVVMIFVALTTVFIFVYLFSFGLSKNMFYG